MRFGGRWLRNEQREISSMGGTTPHVKRDGAPVDDRRDAWRQSQGRHREPSVTAAIGANRSGTDERVSSRHSVGTGAETLGGVTHINAAGPIARVVATWRRRRETAAQDAFVQAWKTAWAEGCRHRWEGGSRGAPSHVQDDQRAAWVAGWHWADAHPDRRRPDGPSLRGYRRSTDRRARLARTARRGLVGLTLVAAARWWWRR